MTESKLLAGEVPIPHAYKPQSIEGFNHQHGDKPFLPDKLLSDLTIQKSVDCHAHSQNSISHHPSVSSKMTCASN